MQFQPPLQITAKKITKYLQVSFISTFESNFKEKFLPKFGGFIEVLPETQTQLVFCKNIFGRKVLRYAFLWEVIMKTEKSLKYIGQGCQKIYYYPERMT